MRCSKANGSLISSKAAVIAFDALRWPPPVSEIKKSARLVNYCSSKATSPNGSQLGPSRGTLRSTKGRIPYAPAGRGKSGNKGPGRSVVKTEDVAKLDIGVSVV